MPQQPNRPRQNLKKWSYAILVAVIPIFLFFVVSILIDVSLITEFAVIFVFFLILPLICAVFLLWLARRNS